MDKLDDKAREALDLDFWRAVARLADDNLCFAFPFDLASSAGLAGNKYRLGLGFRMFQIFIAQHVRRFDIVIRDAAGVAVLSVRTKLEPLAAALEMCKAKLDQPPGKTYRYRIEIHEVATGLARREIVDTEVTHPATAMGLLDDVYEELQDEGARE